MTITGLPLHPLIVHAAVVFTPLAVLFAVVFAVVPRWRYLTRWPTVVATVLSLGSVWAARITGQAFASSRPELAQLVAKHSSYGRTLSLVAIAFTVVVLVGAWALGGDSGFSNGAGARPSRGAVLDKTMPVLVVVVALAVLVLVVLTGDAGSRAAWG